MIHKREIIVSFIINIIVIKKTYLLHIKIIVTYKQIIVTYKQIIAMFN